MEFTVEQIAGFVQGKVVGDGKKKIRGIAGLKEAGESDISFLKDVKNQDAVASYKTTSAGAVLVPAQIDTNGKTVVVVNNPMEAFVSLLQVVEKERNVVKPGIHPSAVVSPSAKIGSGVFIGPLCVIEDGAEIGDNVSLMAQIYIGKQSKVGAGTLFYSNVVLRENVSVGARCIFHPGVVIGSDGYGFYFDKGRHNKIPQIGTVIIEDDVEIGANSAIDRATTGATIIRKGTKIDNLVHLAHNVEVGELSLLAAQVGVAGSAKLGKGVVFGGQVGVGDHVTVGDRVQVGGQSGINRKADAGEILFGTPAQPILETQRQMLLIRRLSSLFKDVKKIKEKLNFND